MEEKNTEIQETIEKKSNKVLTFIKDHKKNIRDFALGAGAVCGLIFLSKLGSNSDADEDGTNSISPVSESYDLIPENPSSEE